MKIKLLLFIVALAAPFAAMAQQRQQSQHQHRKGLTDAHVTGHVVDKYNKVHIPYASVVVNGTTIGVSTDATGHFFLKNMPLGEHTITATFMGYKSQEVTVVVKKNQTAEVEFMLEPNSLQIGEVVVTGSRNATDRRKSASVVNVVPTTLFDNTASSNVAEALNFQAGLRVEQTCQNCGVPQLRINGLEGQYSQILLDSKPIFSSLANVYGLEQMPASMIERVEVLRGGGSALFGSSAIGGVVNIITKEPLRNSFTLANQTSLYGKNNREFNTTLNGSFVSDDYKTGVYIFGMVKDKDAYDRDRDGFSESPLLDGETMGFRGYYKLSPQSKVTAEYHHIREYRRGGNNRSKPPHESDITEQLRHKINGGGVRYDLFSRDYRHRLNITASAQMIDRESYFGTAGDLDAYGSTDDATIVVGGQYTYSFKKCLFMPAELTMGVEYTDSKLRDEMLGYNRVIDQHVKNAGGYIQNEWRSDKLSLLVGARLDKNNKIQDREFVLSPRANVRYTPIPEVGLRVSYASGFRAPQTYDEDMHVEAVGGAVALVQMSPDLRPEYSNSVSGSVDLYRNFGKVEANLLIEGFYTDIKDVFTLTDITPEAETNKILERQNSPGAVVQGVNLELKLGLSQKLVVDAGFTFQKSRYKEPEQWSANEDLVPQRRMFRTPDRYGYFAINYTPVKRFTATVSGNYTGSMLVQHCEGYISSDREEITPEFVDMGFRFAYDFQLSVQTKLQLSVGMKNVLNQFQKDLDKGNLRDAGYIYGPAMPRMVYFGVKFMM